MAVSIGFLVCFKKQKKERATLVQVGIKQLFLIAKRKLPPSMAMYQMSFCCFKLLKSARRRL